MGPNAIDNTNLVNICNNACNVAGFVPTVAFEYDAAAKTIKVKDTSTIPDGDTAKITHFSVIDRMGGEVVAHIDEDTELDEAGKLTIDVSTLNPADGLVINCTVITTNRISADGRAGNQYNGIGAAGNIDHWDVKQNA
jgi:hypothetical protein